MNKLKLYVRNLLIDLYFMKLEIGKKINLKQWLIPLIYIINYICNFNFKLVVFIIFFTVIYIIYSNRIHNIISLLSLLLSLFCTTQHLHIILFSIIIYECIFRYSQRQYELYITQTTIDTLLEIPDEKFILDEHDYSDDNDYSNNLTT